MNSIDQNTTEILTKLEIMPFEEIFEEEDDEENNEEEIKINGIFLFI